MSLVQIQPPGPTIQEKLMKKPDRKSFTCYKFGLEFQIIINGTTTTAVLQDFDRYPYGVKFVGVAILHEPDVYDYQLGKMIAMRAALIKLHSRIAGDYAREIAGIQNQLWSFEGNLDVNISRRRYQQGLVAGVIEFKDTNGVTVNVMSATNSLKK